jgi:hypothetical protein
MNGLTEKNFGYLIAFGLPGFLLLWGASYSFAEIAEWLAKAKTEGSPTIGSFLYVTVASLTLGLLLSAIRWATLEQIFYRSDLLSYSSFDDAELKIPETRVAYQMAIDDYYRYYQFYSHSLIAILISTGLYFCCSGPKISYWILISAACICVALLWKSYDEITSFNVFLEKITK